MSGIFMAAWSPNWDGKDSPVRIGAEGEYRFCGEDSPTGVWAFQQAGSPKRCRVVRIVHHRLGELTRVDVRPSVCTFVKANGQEVRVETRRHACRRPDRQMGWHLLVWLQDLDAGIAPLAEPNWTAARLRRIERTVATAINAADPLRLLDMGCPPDEYQPEIQSLATAVLNTNPDPDTLAQLTKEIFEAWFYTGCAPEETYRCIAAQITAAASAG